MITVEATVHCETKDCANTAKVKMYRGYDDACWRISDTACQTKLVGWVYANDYFGENELSSKAICPSCVQVKKIVDSIPKTIEERISALESKK